jgi:predicted NAD/FAD-binding protein
LLCHRLLFHIRLPLCTGDREKQGKTKQDTELVEEWLKARCSFVRSFVRSFYYPFGARGSVVVEARCNNPEE